MLKYRIKIVECVLKSSNENLVENAINQVIEEMVDNGVSNKRFSQYIQFIEADILFQMRLQQTQREISNLTQALKIIKAGVNLEKTIV